MLRRQLFLCIVFWTVAASAQTAKQPGISWSPLFLTGDQLFPSYILATSAIPPRNNERPYYLGEPDGLIGVEVINPAPNSHVKVSVKIDRLEATGSFDGVLEVKGEKYEIFPKILYRYDILPKFHQLVPANVTVSLYVNGRLAGQQAAVVRIHSINDCLRAYRQTDGRLRTMPWMFAAYVNENHPAIDQILGEALDTKLVNAFVGYQKGTDEVYKQVFAIWDVFQRRGFRYSTITITPTTGANHGVTSQAVRLVDDSLRTSQANCIDGSVLFASVLRRVGIDPFLVLIPHHAFLGFYLEPEHKTTNFLETTRMGSVDLNEATGDTALDSVFSEQAKDTVSYKSFVSAVRYGLAEYTKNRDKLLNPAADINYRLVDIGRERKRGIIPIAIDDAAPLPAKPR
ncbi:MAG TPA: hypothetical protein VKU19_12540 [Bryobacteraceae bacterium]|nr:hypothetical protein [Bryobacteraceae bacterium]